MVSMQPAGSRRDSNKAWWLSIVASAAFVSGGLMAKSALYRLHKWEQQSNEDTLAYDLAYTSSETYGSFSTDLWSEDELDRFDI